jgi:predicted HTH transcriptional regulator
MTAERLTDILQKGESIDVEFKTSQFELNKDAFETICAFLNRMGGHLLLGVRNDGIVEGVIEGCVQNIVTNIVTNANNPQKLSPPFYLSTQVIKYKDKKVIYVYVPGSSQVHSTNGKIFDRNEDGDFDITRQTEQVTQLYLRKHLPDKFYQEGEQRVSLRDRIFREVVGNLLVHREFANAFPAKFIIEKDQVYVENWNRPHNGGVIDPANFSPYPKNPIIAKFFKEIGRVDELGSGVRNTFKYCGIYTHGTQPEFIEDDIFKTIIPLKVKGSKEAALPSDWEEVRRKVRRKFGENRRTYLRQPTYNYL